MTIRDVVNAILAAVGIRPAGSIDAPKPFDPEATFWAECAADASQPQPSDQHRRRGRPPTYGTDRAGTAAERKRRERWVAAKTPHKRCHENQFCDRHENPPLKKEEQKKKECRFQKIGDRTLTASDLARRCSVISTKPSSRITSITASRPTIAVAIMTPIGVSAVDISSAIRNCSSICDRALDSLSQSPDVDRVVSRPRLKLLFRLIHDGLQFTKDSRPR